MWKINGIVTLPAGERVLRGKAKRVPAVDGSVRKLAEEMIELLKAESNGAGLAAPQVGVPLRMIVVKIFDDDDEAGAPFALVNPKLVRAEGEQSDYEGCLSVPGYWGLVRRRETVVVEALDIRGKKIRMKKSGFNARLLQHEIDHLDGILFIDRVEDPKDIITTEELNARLESEQGERAGN